MRERNRMKEAFKEGGNLVGLAGAAGLSLATLNPAPLLVGLVAEAGYLLFVPDSRWYSRRLTQKDAAAAREEWLKLRNQTLPTLRPFDQERFLVLERTRKDIEQQQAEINGAWHDDVLKKLDYLLERYLHFASKGMQYRVYLAGLGQTQSQLAGRQLPRLVPGIRDLSDPAARTEYARTADSDALLQVVAAAFGRQEDRLAHEMERERDKELLEVMRKNAEVLRSSREGVQRIGKILRSIEHQLDLLTNTFTLINTQMRIQSPEEILEEVDQVVNQSEALTQTIQEFAPLEEALARLEAATRG